MPHRTYTHLTAPTTITPARRRVVASLVALSLSAVLTISLAGAAGAKDHAASTTSAQPKTYQPSGHGTTLARGVVNMAKLPTITPRAVTTIQSPLLPAPDALTPTQRQVYNERAQKASASLVSGIQLSKPATTPSAAPSFVGGGVLPLLVKQFDGLNSTQAVGGTGEAAVATDLSYVMEGVDNAIAIYSAASGARLYGPYSPDSFFAPVKHAGDLFAYPQMYYDTMRDRWIVLYLEIAPSHTVDYLDLAVSQSTSPTQPSPGAQYNVYQFGTNFAPSGGVNSYCDYETLGVDYWGIYVTCTNYRNSGFVGNTVLAINKAPMLTGGTPNTWSWNDRVASNHGPSIVLSPATEEGVQDAEFIVGTDAGYGVGSQNLPICALTNLRNIAVVTPTFSCLTPMLPFGYFDPLPARQPGGPNTIGPGYGTKQVYYKAGCLFLAWTNSNDNPQDHILWAEVQSVLYSVDDANPQVINGIEVIHEYTYFAPSGEDYYTPSIIGTDEDDVALVYNHSGTSTYPSIFYTGRKATDLQDAMGQKTQHNAVVVFGTHTTTAYWGHYSACAISLNSVTRGGAWCVGEYAGSVADPGWNTRLFNLRAE